MEWILGNKLISNSSITITDHEKMCWGHKMTLGEKPDGHSGGPSPKKPLSEHVEMIWLCRSNLPHHFFLKWRKLLMKKNYSCVSLWLKSNSNRLGTGMCWARHSGGDWGAHHLLSCSIVTTKGWIPQQELLFLLICSFAMNPLGCDSLWPCSRGCSGTWMSQQCLEKFKCVLWGPQGAHWSHFIPKWCRYTQTSNLLTSLLAWLGRDSAKAAFLREKKLN